MPQTYDGGAIFLAQFALAEGLERTLEQSKALRPSQLQRMRRSMEAAHGSRRVPAGGGEYLDLVRTDVRFDMSRTILIDDSRLVHIWNRFRGRAVEVLSALPPNPRGLCIAKRLVAGLQTRSARAMLNAYRAQYDRRTHGSDEEAAKLRRSILDEAIGLIGAFEDQMLVRRIFAC